MTTMEQIRQQYPAPVQSPLASGHPCVPQTYCTGGAVCAVADQQSVWSVHTRPPFFRTDFPHEAHIALALLALNPALTRVEALVAAREITDHNDRKDFEAAWQGVHRALTP